jgi:hypothetical protein
MERLKTYNVIGRAVKVHADAIVKLDEKQAFRRRHHLATVDDGLGIYRVTGPFELKKGETFGYDGSFPKGVAALVEDVDKAVQEPAEDAESSARPRGAARRAK